MKRFNVTAKAYDLCSSSPKQSMLICDHIHAESSEKAEQSSISNCLVDDITVEKIYSVEEIKEPS